MMVTIFGMVWFLAMHNPKIGEMPLRKNLPAYVSDHK
jgi:hypothetical protein